MAKKLGVNDSVPAVNPAEEFVPPTFEESGESVGEAPSDANEGGLTAATDPNPVDPLVGIGDEADGTVTIAMEVDFPFFIGPMDSEKHGYISSRIDCTLTGDMGATFRRLLLGCRERHLTYSFNGRMTHVESGNDLVRWMVENLADQMRGRSDVG